jgi:hypothetical protein
MVQIGFLTGAGVDREAVAQVISEAIAGQAQLTPLASAYIPYVRRRLFVPYATRLVFLDT